MEVWELVTKRQLTQVELAFLLGCNQSTLSKSGVIAKGDDWVTSLRKYIFHVHEVASGRKGDAGDLDLVQEAARLKKLQGDRISFEMKVKKREVIHIESMAHAISNIFSTVKMRISALPSRLRASNVVTTAGFKIATDEIYNLLNDLSKARLDPQVTARLAEMEGIAWGKEGIEDENSKSDIGEVRENDRGAVHSIPRRKRAAPSKKTRRNSNARDRPILSGIAQSLRAPPAAAVAKENL